MLDFFAIFTRGGIVLWYFQGTSQLFTPAVNSLIKTVFLQERTDRNFYNYDSLTLKYSHDNEFDLVFVVAYQKILQLSYIDKFLSDIQIEFRDKYKNDLVNKHYYQSFSFDTEFDTFLKIAEKGAKIQKLEKSQMRTFAQSEKSSKTVESMILKKNGIEVKKSKEPVSKPEKVLTEQEELIIMENRAKLACKALKKNSTNNAKTNKENKQSPVAVKSKKQKQKTIWDNGGTTSAGLDYSEDKPNEADTYIEGMDEAITWKNTMKGNLRDIDNEDVDDEEEVEIIDKKEVQQKKSAFGFLSSLTSLISSKSLTDKELQPVIIKMKEHLIAKNVASETAEKLCDSVAQKLIGKVLGTFGSVQKTVKEALHESCLQILSPKRRIDILRDIMDCKEKQRPYTIVFCGVNGVGKSTNLAKIAFWLIENGFRVLIAACDTFRAGAVEQLRTHTRKLNALHPPNENKGIEVITLFEKGYGKDAASIALESVNFARDNKYDVVLIDTAGRMQDNEPLMRSLTKLIRVNQPDLVLFVGEALVGNEAVDQLMKFNQSLADFSNMEVPRLIDGIILTKFDTIDDKVGASISMTYTTGQPIIFVGTGQTYTDLKNLNAKAVVNSLLR